MTKTTWLMDLDPSIQWVGERDIKLLKRIIHKIEDKYNILNENNRLLQENCELLKDQ